MKILEEFWYGNIEPTDYDTSSCKEYKKLHFLQRRPACMVSLFLWIHSS